MLMFIILVIVIGLFLFIFFAKKTDSTQNTSDFSHPYPSTTSSCDSFQDNDDKGIDNCSSNAESNSDSSSCDSNSNND
ncbi:hypothetical protein NDN11_11830 [Acinetobacter sp. C26M]|uniref:hypothetical protein n=1 Tax=unclassified Acinetobacter TaxID=196816 RepID=UPI0020368E39|nr:MULTISPECIES: hypothetical protein [unclassified Acinetobacter]USA45411.1 hypothetical protein NDN11_11830 [Acinetobacter sp. C26M]USA48913.1 hypothetical protein NDN12_11830 [Acinetobacter sp. C26G]